MKLKENYCFKTTLEIGTGTAAIPISILLNTNDLDFYSIDLSLEALKIANKNYDTHRKEILAENNTLSFIHGDCFDSIKQEKLFDCIVSNPPYLTPAEFLETQEEIQKYEPKMAFVAEQEGLSFYSKIASAGKIHLKKKGIVHIEHGSTQQLNIIQIFEERSYTLLEKLNDYSSLPRILTFQLD